MPGKASTPSDPPLFDFDAYPPDTLFHERRQPIPIDPNPKAPPPKKERRRRVDPTTFEKQYSPDEIEFMNAMQAFKNRSGKPFPTHGEVLEIAADLGYRKHPPAEPAKG